MYHQLVRLAPLGLPSVHASCIEAGCHRFIYFLFFFLFIDLMALKPHPVCPAAPAFLTLIRHSPHRLLESATVDLGLAEPPTKASLIPSGTETDN